VLGNAELCARRSRTGSGSSTSPIVTTDVDRSAATGRIQRHTGNHDKTLAARLRRNASSKTEHRRRRPHRPDRRDGCLRSTLRYTNWACCPRRTRRPVVPTENDPGGPVIPVGPVNAPAPVGPNVPVGPDGPVNPIGPVAPANPTLPCGPVGPVGPPLGPVCPPITTTG